ncbi:MAG: HAMP domain-containing sensor histidine kinase [Roseivirga sp.]
MLSLQLYFLYTTYQGEKQEFAKDINASLQLALPGIQEERLDEVYRLYVQDMTDTTLIKLEWNTDDPTKTAFEVKDPKTGQIVLSYSYTRDEKSDTIQDLRNKLTDLLMGMGRNQRVYFGLTKEVDRRRELYFDTVRLDLKMLRDTLDQSFAALDIPLDYRFELLDSLTTPEDLGVALYTEPQKAYDRSEEDLIVVFDRPIAHILARMNVVLVASVTVIILIAIAFIALFRTISRQRRLSSIKDDFIDSMTHELLTPIATLKISLETLENKEVWESEEKTSRYLKISKMELSRVSDIVHNVLYSSLHEQQEAKLKIERINVNEMLDDLVNYHSDINQGGVDIQCQSLEDPWISTDRQHLNNVLHNLIDNGIKYANGQANITIIPTRHKGEMSIVVNDNGCGIPESEQSRVFEKFYRARDVQDIKGLGVGLYYVKTILTRLRGSVELLHSSPKGSSFKVSLKTAGGSE